MADGSIEFSTNLDNSDLEKQLKAAEKKIDSLKSKLESAEGSRNAIADQLDEANAAANRMKDSLDKLKARMDELREAGKGPGSGAYDVVSGEWEKQHAEYLKQLDTISNLNDKWIQADDKVTEYTSKISEAEAEAKKLGNAVKSGATHYASNWATASDAIKAKVSGIAANIRASFANAARSSMVSFQGVSASLSSIARKAAVFSIAALGLRKIGSSIMEVAKRNATFNASIENLNSVVSGFLGGVVSVMLPGLISAVNLLAGILERVAGLVDSIFGSNIAGAIQQSRSNASNSIQQSNAQKSAEYANNLAKAQQNQAKSAGKLAKKQKEANRQIMGFDELNVLANESADDLTDSMDNYIPEDIEPPQLAQDWTQNLVPDAGIFSGILDWLDQLRDRILNDVEGPFARIREGLQLIKTGWDEIVRGIQTGDWALVWKGIGDIVIGALYVIEGALGAFLDWFDQLTGGRFHESIEGLKLMLHGIVEFIEGVLRGDFALAFQGLHDVVNGFVEVFKGLWNSLVTWLDEITGGRFHDILESVRTMMNDVWEGIRAILDGAIMFLEGVFSGDVGKAADGLKMIVSGLVDAISGFVLGACNAIKEIVSGVFGWLRDTFPQLSPLLDFLEGTVRGAIDGIVTFIDGALGAVKGIVSGLIDIIVGIITGSNGRIIDGIKSICYGLLSLIEGAINGIISIVFGFFNGVIGAINSIPGVSFGYLEAPRVDIPRLASGAVIPPNREFLAVLGDQKSGTNVEAPESLIRKIVREESGGVDPLMLQQVIMEAISQAAKGDAVMVLNIDGETLARAVSKGNASLARRGVIKPEFGF